LRALERAGFFIHHTSGSHHILKHPDHPELRITLPMHNRDLKRKTLESIIDQSGLTTHEHCIDTAAVRIIDVEATDREASSPRTTATTHHQTSDTAGPGHRTGTGFWKCYFRYCRCRTRRLCGYNVFVMNYDEASS
jgi:predicted RNA binding protein YcfA (HicA-like mRNA interferase family)